MKFNATVLSIAATLALAACGGGGGSITINGSNSIRQIDPANADKATAHDTHVVNALTQVYRLPK